MALPTFSPASPELLARRTLQRRADSKFVLRTSALAEVFDTLTSDYLVVLAAGQQIATYNTLYFDTADLACYHDHRRGRRLRQKIRIRHYPERQVSFLEIKSKRNSALTVKHRRKRAYEDSELTADDLAFIEPHLRFPAARLRPGVWTNFRRVTLLNANLPERVTIDLQLEFVRGEHRVALDKVAIVEVKQSPFCLRTPVMRALRTHQHRQLSASKYCAGTIFTTPGLPANRLLPVIRTLRGISNE